MDKFALRDYIVLIKRMKSLLEDDHYKCDIESNDECDLMDNGAWQIEYTHGTLRDAKHAIYGEAYSCSCDRCYYG